MSSFNDLYYAASLVEFIGRKSKNRRKDIANVLGIDGIQHLIEYADVNHCLPFERVADELMEDFEIEIGTFDTESSCKYKVPSFLSIGKVYARLVCDISDSPDQFGENLFAVLTSDFSDAISDFNSSLYFAPRAEVAYYYGQMAV